MEIIIHGHNLPGRMFRDAGVPIHEVHVGLQVRKDPEGLVPGDASEASWRMSVRVSVDHDGAFDVAGPAVHGRCGERFVYLTWGNLGERNTFAMFRRAKLMFADIEPALVREALDRDRSLHARVNLTDDRGGPTCGRVRPPVVTWTLG